LVLAATGCLSRHYDDARRFYEAAYAGAVMALAAGASKILLVASRQGDAATPQYERALHVATLGAAAAGWAPLHVRDAPSSPRIAALGLLGAGADAAVTEALLQGYWLAREIGGVLPIFSVSCPKTDPFAGSDPEMTSAEVCAARLQAVFAGTAVQVRVQDNPEEIETQYPLAGAVGRAAKHVPRHRARIVWLTYEGTNPIFARAYSPSCRHGPAV
jgi:leucyl aminopeptidase